MSGALLARGGLVERLVGGEESGGKVEKRRGQCEEEWEGGDVAKVEVGLEEVGCDPAADEGGEDREGGQTAVGGMVEFQCLPHKRAMKRCSRRSRCNR